MSLKKSVLFLVLAFSTFISGGYARAEGEPPTGPTVHITIRAGEEVYSGDVPAPESSTVLSVLSVADEASAVFEVTNVESYSFGDYLKCVSIEGLGEKCDDWQYVIDGDYPSTSIDQTSAFGAGSIYFYFSAKDRITLSADAIDSDDTLTVTAESYDYEGGAWELAEGATIGLGVPDTSGSFAPPTEIMQGTTDAGGQVSFSNVPEGSYEVGIRDEYGYYFPSKALTVTAAAAAPAESSGGGSSGGGSSKSKRSGGEVLGAETVVHKKFDVKKGYEFLISQQKENGSFGADMYTDWAAMALASGNYQANTIKLIAYLSQSPLENPRLTDYERRAMALMALGLNPYHTNGMNYIGKIVEAFDGTQFGEVTEDNDDTFALLALLNAGYAPEEDMMGKSAAFVLGRQRENGSWDESIDMTGATMVALARLPRTEAVQSALDKAKEFLKEAQSSRLDASWINSASSTAWALEGLKAIGEDEKDWTRDDILPSQYLGSIQEADGGIKNENADSRLWETAYVLSALSGKTWPETMQKFAKVEIAPAKPAKIAQANPKPLVPEPLGHSLTGEAKPKIDPAGQTATLLLASGPTDTEQPENTELETETPEPGQSWFRRLLGNIFGF